MKMIYIIWYSHDSGTVIEEYSEDNKAIVEERLTLLLNDDDKNLLSVIKGNTVIYEIIEKVKAVKLS